MAITMIGQAGVSGGDQTSPQVINYTSTAGNALILVGFFYYSGNQIPGITSIVDSANNNWQYSTSSSQKPPFGFDPFNANNSIQFVAWCLDAAAITSLTLTMPTVSPWTRMALSEWSGIAAVDSTASAVASGGTIATATLNLSGNNDLVVGAFENNVGYSFNPPAGWSQFTSAGANNVAYGFPGVSGIYNPTFTLSTSSDWGVAFAAFRSTYPPGAMMAMFP